MKNILLLNIILLFLSLANEFTNLIDIIMNQEVDPEKVAKWVKLSIAVLTAILGFLTGMGTATACNFIF